MAAITAETIELKIKRSGSAAGKGIQDLSSSMKKIRGESEKSSKSVNRFVESLKRIAMYRMLRTILKDIARAFSEGLKNAYLFNSIAGGEMSKALDKLKSAAVMAKGQIGSAFGELLANITPILVSILNLITRVADAISQLFAVLGGRSKYTKAVASSEKWADATSKGAAAAKEWKNQLMGFDEINRLEEPADSSGGSGTSPYEGMYELADATNEWAKKLREITLDWWKGIDLEPITKAWERLKNAVSDFVGIVDNALYWAYTNVLLPFAQWRIEKGLPAELNLLAAAFELLVAVLKRLQPVVEYIWKNIFEPLFQKIGDIYVKAVEKLTKEIEGLTNLVNGDTSFREWLKALSPIEEVLLSIGIAIGIVAAALTACNTAIKLYNTVSTIMTTITGGLSTVLSFLAANPIVLVTVALAALVLIGIEVYKNWDDLSAKAKELWESMNENFGNGKIEFSDFAVVAIQTISGVIMIISDLIKGIATLVGWIQTAFGWAKSATEQFNEMNKAGSYSKDLGNGRTFNYTNTPGMWASGGFVDEGQLFISRESGPELVGTIGNQTAVVNNDQIVESVSAGVFNAMVSAIGSTGGMGGDRDIRIYMDGKEIARTTTKYQQQFARSGTM